MIVQVLAVAASVDHRGEDHHWEEEHACGLPQMVRCLPVVRVRLTHQPFFLWVRLRTTFYVPLAFTARPGYVVLSRAWIEGTTKVFPVPRQTSMFESPLLHFSFTFGGTPIWLGGEDRD